MDNNSYKKYIKYKTRYLRLKQSLTFTGGNGEDICVANDICSLDTDDKDEIFYDASDDPTKITTILPTIIADSFSHEVHCDTKHKDPSGNVLPEIVSNSFFSFFSNAASSITSGASSIANGMVNAVSTTANAIALAASSVSTSTVNAVSGVAIAAVNAASAIKDTTVATGNSFLDSIINAVTCKSYYSANLKQYSFKGKPALHAFLDKLGKDKVYDGTILHEIVKNNYEYDKLPQILKIILKTKLKQADVLGFVGTTYAEIEKHGGYKAAVKILPADKIVLIKELGTFDQETNYWVTLTNLFEILNCMLSKTVPIVSDKLKKYITDTHNSLDIELVFMTYLLNNGSDLFKLYSSNNTETITQAQLTKMKEYNIWDFFTESIGSDVYIFPPILLLLLSLKIKPEFSQSEIANNLILSLSSYGKSCKKITTDLIRDKKLTAPEKEISTSIIANFDLGINNICSDISTSKFTFRSFDNLIKTINTSKAMKLFIRTKRHQFKFLIISNLAPVTAFLPFNVNDYLIPNYIYNPKCGHSDKIKEKIRLFKRKYRLYEDVCRYVYAHKGTGSNPNLGVHEYKYGHNIPSDATRKINVFVEKIIKEQKEKSEYKFEDTIASEWDAL